MIKYDALNYCRNATAYQQVIADSQWRCDINGTTELVVLLDGNGDTVASTALKPSGRKVVRNSWR
jgi:hypothetical protein